MLPAEKSVRLRDGTRLAYIESGMPTRTTVVMLHGATDSWRSFAPVLPHLPPLLHAIAPSQRGHGESDRPAAGYRTEEMAADLADFLDARSIRRAVIVGHSMGGSVALRFAIDHPDRTLGLVLAGARARWADHPEVAALSEEVFATVDPVDRRFVRAFQASTVAQPVPPAFIDAMVAESLKLPARTWHAVFREAVLGADETARLGRVRAPTLLLCGDRDTLAHDAQAALARGIPGALRLTYRGAGHALHWEEPARFAADLGAFATALSEERLADTLSA
ncbi:alpha/beta fold hydrolase [Falsiroseomonas oryzae]|uniref:alpha/beta fold hydrolase n=1 Tax=Falsiroseomonas oryzae TaxID=2766473 RepID=UPI0022EA5CA7|nr:alpha/beta hydrolase [Roseomonas sp. MO-31]